MRWLLLCVAGCGGADFYAPCDAAEDCAVPDDAEAECLDEGDQGFCTWACGDDGDCADAVDTDYDFVCAPWESEAGMHCFPSCEGDEEACPPGYGCRSTGGGSENRKVCFPEG